MLIFLTWDEERFPESISVIDKEACWNGSEVLCLLHSLAVGSPDVVSNIELENQRIRITQDVFTGMNISFLHMEFFSRFHLFPPLSLQYISLVLSLFQFLTLSSSHFLSGLESDFLWLILQRHS